MNALSETPCVFKNACNEWRSKEEFPSWMSKALSQPLTALTGGYSIVFPLDSKRVVKFVNESGAFDYLSLCRKMNGKLAHFPQIFEILEQPFFNTRTQQVYRAVVMESLEHQNKKAEELALIYCGAVTLFAESFSCNVELSHAALVEASEILKAKHRSLSSSMSFLADELVLHQWVVDLGNSLNWMYRSDGTVVLSDPIHHVNNFADDLI